MGGVMSSDEQDAARYRALRERITAGTGVERGRPPHFVLPYALNKYAHEHNLYKGSVAGHLDSALDEMMKGKA